MSLFQHYQRPGSDRPCQPVGQAMFTIIGAMAERKSDLISERVKAGMAAAKARGRHVGVNEDLQQEIREKVLDRQLSAQAIARMYKGRAPATRIERWCTRSGLRKRRNSAGLYYFFGAVSTSCLLGRSEINTVLWCRVGWIYLF